MDNACDRRLLIQSNKEYKEVPRDIAKLVHPEIDFDDLEIKNKSFYLHNRKGEMFHVKKWSLDQKKEEKEYRAVIFYVHGFSGNVGNLNEMSCKVFAKEGNIVYSMDGYGHGCSDGLYLYIPDFDKYCSDYVEIYSKLAAKHPDLKKFLIGVSLGGAVVFKMMLQDAKDLFSGSVFISPMLKLSPERIPNFALVKTLSVMSYLFPTLKATPEDDFVKEIYINEKLYQYSKTTSPFENTKNVRLKTSFEILKYCCSSSQYFEKFTKPFLVLHGLQDKVTYAPASKDFYDAAASTDKVLKLFEDQKHSLLHDNKAKEKCSIENIPRFPTNYSSRKTEFGREILRKVKRLFGRETDFPGAFKDF